MRMTIALLVAVAGSISTGHAVDRPNILLIVADDLGYSDLGCYGGEIATPNLDALGHAGVRLSQFYNAGRCCPSRASILTGQYPHRVGLGHMTHDLGGPGYRGRGTDDRSSVDSHHESHRAVREGNWKLVAVKNEPWELYDFSHVRTELDNVADKNPHIVSQLSLKWDQWATENLVTPLPKDYRVNYLK